MSALDGTGRTGWWKTVYSAVGSQEKNNTEERAESTPLNTCEPGGLGQGERENKQLRLTCL